MSIIKYVMKGTINSPPYQDVTWSVYNAPDFTGAQSGYGNLINIVVDYQVVDNVPVGGNTGSAPLPPVPTPPPSDPINPKYTYSMSGLLTTAPFQLVKWNSPNAPDYTGALSGYAAGTINNIVVDYVTVDDVSRGITSTNIIGVGGDLSGFLPNPEVVGLRTIPISSIPPTNQQVLLYNSTLNQWVPNTPLSGPPSGAAGGDLTGFYPNPTVATSNGHIIITNVTTAGGDLSGTYPNPNVIKLQNIPVKSGTPTNGQILTYVSGNGDWEAQDPAPSFTAGGDLTGTATNQTVIGLRTKSLDVSLASIGAAQDGYALTWVNGSNDWQAKPIPSGFTAAHDLSGTSSSQTVIGIQGNPVLAQTLGASQDGYIATWKQADGKIEFLPNSFTGTITLGGDTTGPSNANTVVALRGKSLDATLASLGASQDGYLLTWVNGSNDWQAKPNNFTGTVTLAGDVTGPSNANTVVNIHGASVPVAGSLTTGNVLQVNGASSLTYAPVNLAGGSNYVTGVLPNGNQQAQTLGGDLSGTTASATVLAIHGTTVPASPVNGQVLTATSSSTATWQNPTTQGFANSFLLMGA